MMNEVSNSVEKFNFNFGGGNTINAVAFADTIREITNFSKRV